MFRNEKIIAINHNFDWKQYIYNYKDLQDGGINTRKKAINHWICYGKNEGRHYRRTPLYNDNEITLKNEIKLVTETNLNSIDETEVLSTRPYNTDIEYFKKMDKKEKERFPETNLKNEIKLVTETNLNSIDDKEVLSTRPYNTDIEYFKKMDKKEKERFNEITLKNEIKLVTETNLNSIDETEVLRTKLYNMNHSNYNPEKIDIKYLKYIDNFILIVDFPNSGGGTTEFINRIISKYKFHKIFLIVRNYNNKIVFTINDEYEINTIFNNQTSISFLKENINCLEKIFVNHTIGHDILFLNELFKLNKEVTYITHDFYLIHDIPNPLIHNIQLVYTNDNKININNFNKIITQNEKNLLVFDKHIQNNDISVIISELPDYKDSFNLIKSSNNKIVIGIFGDIIEIKGLNILRDIIKYYKNNKFVTIIVFGLCYIPNFKNQYTYNSIEELNKLLINFKPNILMELSIWSETYSYTLTLKMITRLPIIYFKKTGNFVVENRLSNYDKAYSFESLAEFNKLIKLHNQNYFYTIKPTIYFNSFFDEYFNNLKTDKIISNANLFKNNISIYPIYFPQFHNIEENNRSFYNGYTDIENLNLLSQTIKTETPSLKDFEINHITEYDLENINIIQKQVDLLDDYNLSGFALYYYWFSKNTITNVNMIMEKVVNLFFTNEIILKNKKIFFIWANESWTRNPAFGNCIHTIENEYTLNDLQNNVNNLINYFIHENYLKVNNKPVLLLYHEWFMTMDEIKLFHDVLNAKCIEHNFDGIQLVVNSMNNNKIVDFSTFYLNFNYKKSPHTYRKNNKNCLDYKKYIDEYKNSININNNTIQTLVFNFDNRARLYKPNKLEHSTICINNNLFNKILFMTYIFDKYENNNNILLFNAWNEWGEGMTLEPSNEYGYLNLNLLDSFITKYFNTVKNMSEY